MSNLKGAILAMALWVGVVFPFLLMLGIDSFQQRAYLATTEKIADLVRQEGGVSDQVIQVANNLSSKGYTVTFSKPSLVQFGEEIVIRYRYEYPNVRGKQKLDTQNKVVITKRSMIAGGGSNPSNPPGATSKTYTRTTPESLNANGEYTFTIPGLNNLKRVISNTGNVEIVSVNGENVTVKVSKGAVIRTVQTGGIYAPADTKFVTGEDSPDYNKDGYTGKLNQYLHSGGILPADSKEITDIKTSLFPNNFPGSIVYAMNGYSGFLMKNGVPSRKVIAGEYIPADTKWVEGATAEKYNNDGYVGTLERYTVSGEYIPEKIITDSLTNMTNTFPDTVVKDGVTLYRTGDSKKSILTEQETKNISIEVAGPRWHWAKETPSSSTYDYSQDGYIGTLQAIGNPTYSTKHSSEWTPAIVGIHNTNYYSNNLSELNGQVKNININPNERLNGESAIEYIVRSNEATLRAMGRVNPKIIENSIRWKSSIEYGNFLYNGVYYPYKRVITADYTYDAFRWFQVYGGNVTKDAVYQYTQEYSAVLPASDSRVYAYKGYVTKPAVDTQIYEYIQNYAGTVTRPEMDTRIYKYQGKVIRPSSDSRTYENYYQYELSFEYH